MNTLELEVLCSGQDGSAAGSVLSSSPLSGNLQGIFVERDGAGATAMPDTNEIRVTDVGPPELVLLYVRGKTDTEKLYCPRTPAHYVDGEPILYEAASAVGVEFPLTGKIKVEVNNANNGDKVTATLLYA